MVDLSRRGWLVATAATGLMAMVPAQAAPASTTEHLDIWPGGIGPGSAGLKIDQKVTDRSTDPAKPDRYTTGTTRPYLTIHRPAQPNGAAVLITPGGAYQRVVVDKEGLELVPPLLAAGFTVFILYYRLPGEGHEQAADVPLQDAQRALRLIRHRAADWQLDPNRIAMMGFSAGGHLAASLGTRLDTKVYEAVDEADRLSARPDALALIYPVIDMVGPATHAGSRTNLLGEAAGEDKRAAYSPDRAVTAATPPTFLLHAADDKGVPVENSLLFHTALRQAGIPAELHIYAKGGHGFGHGDRIPADNPLTHWPDVLIHWLRPTLGLNNR
ncbi:alpha/beta hydrolase [Niveispirillum irakense]|uniref:alpha/beta hydrolase n=1 Tax=Niveispirillum irakense TaxID=34011 RepID=UPI0003F63498|nr:alpha/beta hydrolase [Niveispirillum irakense]